MLLLRRAPGASAPRRARTDQAELSHTMVPLVARTALAWPSHAPPLPEAPARAAAMGDAGARSRASRRARLHRRPAARAHAVASPPAELRATPRRLSPA